VTCVWVGVCWQRVDNVLWAWTRRAS